MAEVEETALRKLQLVELGLMKRFAELCDEHKLRYYLLGGTLLGAVRHGGFIPWDDDVDICMPRPDYERFLEVAEEALANDEYSLVCLQNDASYRQGMAKMTTGAMRVINRSSNEERLEDAWIDIIPLDGFPKDGIGSLVHKVRLMFWKVMDATAEFDYVIDVRRDRGLVGGIALKMLEAFCHAVRPFGDNYHKVLMRTDEALKRYDYEASDKVINLYAARGFKEIFLKEWFGQGSALRFEGIDFSVPRNSDRVLATIYDADYMTPPPEHDRNWHNSEVL